MAGRSFAGYRTVAGDRVRWLRADGNCRATRMLDSMVDISRRKPDQRATVRQSVISPVACGPFRTHMGRSAGNTFAIYGAPPTCYYGE
jgi:hypothetical protein